MEHSNQRLILMSRNAVMEYGGILEQLFAQCHCTERFSVCSFEDFNEHLHVGTPYLAVLNSRQDCLEAGVLPTQTAVCVMDYDLAQQTDVGNAEHTRILTYSAYNDCADFTARNVHCMAEFGCAFEIVGVGVIGRIKLRTADAQDVQTALLGASVCLACGVPFAEVLASLNLLAVEV